MHALLKTGRIYFGLGIIVYGLQQIIIQDFRSQILPDFPHWAHTWAVFPIVTGALMVVAGVLIAGFVPVAESTRRKWALGLGFYFGGLLLVSHLPYLLFVYPHKLSHLGSWGDALKGLAFSGGSLIVAGSFRSPGATHAGTQSYMPKERLLLIGRIFFCTTIILFGCNHFAYDLSGMVPSWLGMQTFWSYFGGAALIAAGTAILLKIFLKPVSLLLALMLFIWFAILHMPNAIAFGFAGRGNPIVNAFDALLFCGVALILSQTQNATAGTKAVRTGDYDRTGTVVV